MMKEGRLVIRKGKLADFNKLFKFLNQCPELQATEEGRTYTKSWVNSCLTDKKMNLVLIAEINHTLAGFLKVYMVSYEAMW